MSYLKKIVVSVVAVTAASFTIIACTPANESPSAATSAASETATAEQTLAFVDGVVREKPADSDMTAIFGTIVNNSDEDIEVTRFSTSLDAPMNQIHETVDGTMREMTEPMVIPAGQSRELAPGGDHFMVMGYEPALMAGDSVDVTIEFGDGESIVAADVPVRTMGAGHEAYSEDGEMTGHGN